MSEVAEGNMVEAMKTKIVLRIDTLHKCKCEKKIGRLWDNVLCALADGLFFLCRWSVVQG